MKKETVYKIGIWLCFLVFAGSAVLLGIRIWEKVRAEYIYGELLHKSKAAGTKTAADEVPLSGMEEKQILFEELYSCNQDFAGWITVPETKIDYPVVESAEDQDRYLTEDFYGRKSRYGTPFLDARCAVGNADNMIIYGHHMKDGSMFAALLEYESEEFYKEHPDIQMDFYGNGIVEEGTYEIISVLLIQDTSDMEYPYYDFIQAEEEWEFAQYVQAVKENSLYDTGHTADYGDQLLTLSTCEYNGRDGRLAVIARKTKS